MMSLMQDDHPWAVCVLTYRLNNIIIKYIHDSTRLEKFKILYNTKSRNIISNRDYKKQSEYILTEKRPTIKP